MRGKTIAKEKNHRKHQNATRMKIEALFERIEDYLVHSLKSIGDQECSDLTCKRREGAVLSRLASRRLMKRHDLWLRVYGAAANSEFLSTPILLVSLLNLLAH